MIERLWWAPGIQPGSTHHKENIKFGLFWLLTPELDTVEAALQIQLLGTAVPSAVC